MSATRLSGPNAPSRQTAATNFADLKPRISRCDAGVNLRSRRMCSFDIRQEGKDDSNSKLYRFVSISQHEHEHEHTTQRRRPRSERMLKLKDVECVA